jgi:hypothetical protein
MHLAASFESRVVYYTYITGSLTRSVEAEHGEQGRRRALPSFVIS